MSENTMAGNHVEAVVSQFVLGSLIVCSGKFCSTLVILEGHINVLICMTPMALAGAPSLDLSVFSGSCRLRGVIWLVFEPC
jgi:hypothetical protein